MPKETFGSKVKDAFAFGLGTGGGFAVLMCVGLLFLFPAIFLYSRETKRPAEKQRTWVKVFAICLGVVGVALGFGSGGDEVFGMIKNVA